MSNYWHCEKCDSRNHDSKSECWKCFPEADELREELDRTKLALEKAKAYLEFEQMHEYYDVAKKSREEALKEIEAIERGEE